MTALTLRDYLEAVQSLVHDSTNSAWSRREFLARINDARKDCSLDMQCARSLVTGVQLFRGQEIYNFDGAVCGATVTAPGANYQAATVTFGPPSYPSGTQAMATADVVDGEVTAIVMTQWGRGYYFPHPPVITITDPTGQGAGAAAAPVRLFNVINVLSISPLWNTLRYTLAYKGFTVFQAWARALQAQGFTSRPGIFTIHPGDQVVYMDPVPDQTYTSEWDVVREAAPLVGLDTRDPDIPAPYAQAVQFRAAALLLMKHQNFGQVEYYERKYDARVPRIIAGAGGIRIANPYSRNFYTKMRRV